MFKANPYYRRLPNFTCDSFTILYMIMKLTLPRFLYTPSSKKDMQIRHMYPLLRMCIKVNDFVEYLMQHCVLDRIL